MHRETTLGSQGPEARPRVSVIIPTRDRAPLVGGAVKSALAQSLPEIEVLVVVDGPDDATEEVLRGIDDPRLRFEALPAPSGAAAARNAGVARARGEWIAFLDDDDAWLPEKLALQLETARRSSHRWPIVACRVSARSESQDFVWPRRFPDPGEPIGDYLFCRRSLFFGEGLVPTNTVFTPRELLAEVPFDDGLRDHEDIDWLLRVCGREGVGVEFVPQDDPLAVWSLDAEWSRMSDRIDWRWSLGWLRERKHLVTRRAYAAYLLTWLGGAAARAGDRSAFLPLLREAWRDGRPSAIDLLSFLGYWSAPRGLQSRLAALFARRARDSGDG